MSRGLSSAVVAMLVSMVIPPVQAAPSPPGTITGAELQRDPLHLKTIRMLEELGAPPKLLEIFSSEEEVVRTGAHITAWPGGDITGDGREELIESFFSWAITYDSSNPYAFEEEATTKVKLRNARTGRKLWTKRVDDFAIAFPTRVGAKGTNGIVMVSGLLSFFGPAEERYVKLEALNRSGNLLWTQGFQAVSAGNSLTRVALNTPISIATFDGVAGRATDFIAGVGEEVHTIAGFTVASQPHVIDGRTGELIVHPRVDAGVNWYPTPDPVGDIDGDRLDDYIVASNPGLDPGGPQEPPSIGGIVDARSSLDGSSLWTTGGLVMHRFEWTYPLRQLVGNSTREIAIVTPLHQNTLLEYRTYLLDGATGFIRWERNGGFPIVPGDIDGRGGPDVLTHDMVSGGSSGKTGFRQRAIGSTGRRLWTREFVTELDAGLCPIGCFSFTWWGLGRLGDVNADGIVDVNFATGTETIDGSSDEAMWVTDGSRGRTIYKSDVVYGPAEGALDGNGPDLTHVKMWSDAFTVTAITGNGSRQLWRSKHQIPTKITRPRQAYGWTQGIDLRNDRCADLIVGGWADDYSFYGILNGATGKMTWSRQNGDEHRPHTIEVADSNPTC